MSPLRCNDHPNVIPPGPAVSEELRRSGLGATFPREHPSHSARIGGVPAQTDPMRSDIHLP